MQQIYLNKFRLGTECRTQTENKKFIKNIAPS